MRAPRLGFSMALLSLIGVGYVVFLDLERISPGPLSRVHAREEALGGTDGCTGCHDEGSGRLTAGCLACHADIELQMKEKRGFHGTLEGADPSRCEFCHVEHQGEGFRLVSREAFARAGVRDPDHYDHARLGFALTGRHSELACSACHRGADAPVPARGEKRFAGLSQACTSCHEDPHEGKMQRACEACHGQMHPFPRAAAFEHTAAFPLVGSHAGPACRDCHPKDALHSIEALSRGVTIDQVRRCEDCHASPHGQRMLAATLGPGGDGGARSRCESCHAESHASLRRPDALMTPELHARLGMSLQKPHDKVACAACHGGPDDGRSYAERFPGRDPARCESCHADPHAGQFTGPGGAVTSCRSCHDADRFVPPRFDVAAHAATAFPLQGRHAELRCEQCHVEPAGGDDGKASGVRRFRGTPMLCEGCHADVHDGAFDGARAGLAPGAGGTCSRCHDTRSFTPVAAARFDHALWTGFPLEGAHKQTRCETCHGRAAEADGKSGRLGHVQDVFPGEPGRCATCHDDPHRGAFARRSGKAAPGDSCAACHGTTSFRLLETSRFDHGRDAGFPLEGRHAGVSCRACHVPRRPSGDEGRGFGFARGRECADCHEDPHGGQFAANGQVACARCHDTGHTFREVAFDHRKTRFPLDARHAGLACSACHRPAPLRDGRLIVRYRPLGTQCADCHGFRTGKGNKRGSSR